MGHDFLAHLSFARRAASADPVYLYGSWVQGLLEASSRQWIILFGCLGWGAGGSLGCLTLLNLYVYVTECVPDPLPDPHRIQSGSRAIYPDPPFYHVHYS
jgi:hypothetical protein